MNLFSRHDCPLCEDVEETLNRLNIAYNFIDIDLDEALRKKYHVLVHVLVNANGAELFWPYDEQSLLEFVSV
jgi:hypothetical protein